ncbi:MAG: Rieske (2Fe-2S) protein [Proteobacteria bacterium]|nr:Rieske (2Fe-2S) protein [Pseudomonadota bacterium]
MQYAKLNPKSFFDSLTFSLEQTELFDKTNYIGHKLMVPEHGTYFELRQPNENKVMINDHGVIRVLSNICRHRNARMLSNRGTISSIVCPIHKWTYDLQGHLVGAPDWENLPKTCLSEENLTVWNGLVFNQLANSSYEQLRNCSFSKYFSFANYCFHSLETHVCNYNWKTFVEVYLDDYHVNPFHPGLGNFVNCNKLKWSFCDSFSVQAVGISEFKKKGTSTYKRWQDQVINFHKSSNLEWGAVWMLIYPNIMVEWYPQTVVISTLYPLEPQKTLNITEFYYTEEIALFNEEYVQSQKEAYKETAREDDEIAERMDQGKQSMKKENKLNPNFLHPTLEKGIPEFYRYLEKYSSAMLRKKYFEPSV